MKALKLLPAFLFFTFITVLVACAEVKIGVTDANKVAEESVAFKNAIDKINAKAEELDKNTIKIQKAFSKKYEDLNKQKNVLSVGEYNKKSDDLNKEVEKENKIFYKQRVKLDQAYNEANETLTKKIREIIQKIAQESGITIVFDKNLTVYSDVSIDITKDVVLEVNKQLKSIDVNLS